MTVMGNNMKGDFAWTANRQIFIPENKVEQVDPTHTYEALRGYSTHLAVMDSSGKCIGYIDTRTLGYDNAKEWLTHVSAT